MAALRSEGLAGDAI